MNKKFKADALHHMTLQELIQEALDSQGEPDWFWFVCGAITKTLWDERPQDAIRIFNANAEAGIPEAAAALRDISR